MFVFPRRLDQLSRFHRWVDLALLFKKGVGREIAVSLKWLTTSFPTSSIPAILFLNFADDALQVTSPKAPFCIQNFFLEALSLQPGRERYTATTLWCSMAKATVAVVSPRKVSPRLARQCGSQEKQRVKQTDQIFKSTKFSHFFFVLRKKGSKTKERMKEEEIEKGDCGPPTRKVFFWFCWT